MQIIEDKYKLNPDKWIPEKKSKINFKIEIFGVLLTVIHGIPFLLSHSQFSNELIF